MTKPLRLLLIEDSEDDATLLLRELSRNGYTVEVLRVETPETLTTALEEQVWDVVISDYALPSLTGLDSLRIVQSQGLDVPFLIVSGTIGEDLAVEALKAGAHDYFIKSNMARLVPAIERELREAETRRQRREAEERFAKAFQLNPLPILIKTLVGERILDVNEEFVALFGYTQAEAIDHTSLDLNLWVDYSVRDAMLERLRAGERVRELEAQLKTRQGEVRDMLVSAEQIELNGVICILQMFQDITERKRLAQQAQEIAVLEARQALARDLHDAVSQMLFSSSVMAEALPRLLHTDPSKVAERLNQLNRLNRAALAEMRNLLIELRFNTEMELGELLHQLAQSTMGYSQIAVSLTLEGKMALPQHIQITLYRVTQELLNNIVKHAHATQIDIILTCTPEQVQLTIRDNGRGFNADMTPEAGLAIVRERLRAINATLQINTQLDHGTAVIITLAGGIVHE